MAGVLGGISISGKCMSPIRTSVLSLVAFACLAAPAWSRGLDCGDAGAEGPTAREVAVIEACLAQRAYGLHKVQLLELAADRLALA